MSSQHHHSVAATATVAIPTHVDERDDDDADDDADDSGGDGTVTASVTHTLEMMRRMCTPHHYVKDDDDDDDDDDTKFSGSRGDITMRAEQIAIDAASQLWDMAALETAALLMHHHSILLVIEKLLSEPHSARLHEVTIGLLANLCSSSQHVAIAATLDDTTPSSSSSTTTNGPSSLLVCIMTLLFTSTDVPTLAEVFRLLHIGTCLPEPAARSTWLIIGDGQVCERAHYLLSITFDATLQERILHYLNALLYYNYRDTITSLLQYGIIDTIVELLQRGHTTSSSAHPSFSSSPLPVVAQWATSPSSLSSPSRRGGNDRASVVSRMRSSNGKRSSPATPASSSSAPPSSGWSDKKVAAVTDSPARLRPAVATCVLTMLEVVTRDARILVSAPASSSASSSSSSSTAASALEKLLPVSNLLLRHIRSVDTSDDHTNERRIAALHAMANLVRCASTIYPLSMILPITSCVGIAAAILDLKDDIDASRGLLLLSGLLRSFETSKRNDNDDSDIIVLATLHQLCERHRDIIALVNEHHHGGTSASADSKAAAVSSSSRSPLPANSSASLTMLSSPAAAAVVSSSSSSSSSSPSPVATSSAAAAAAAAAATRSTIDQIGVTVISQLIQLLRAEQSRDTRRRMPNINIDAIIGVLAHQSSALSTPLS